MPKVQPYPPEFRREAERLVKERGTSFNEASEGLGIAEQTLRNWARQHEVDSGQREGLTTRDRAELNRLRHENAVLIRASVFESITGLIWASGPDVTLISASTLS